MRHNRILDFVSRALVSKKEQQLLPYQNTLLASHHATVPEIVSITGFRTTNYEVTML
ncbi:hypothetical protein J6590_002583 [Homalodisca vitripennis]|nr:hypothetical protein J6590_002583 [Homalodisca vitripennis]